MGKVHVSTTVPSTLALRNFIPTSSLNINAKSIFPCYPIIWLLISLILATFCSGSSDQLEQEDTSSSLKGTPILSTSKFRELQHKSELIYLVTLFG